MRFASGKKAKGVCDRCGFVFRLRELKEEVQNLKKTGIRVCYTCFEPDHPQNMLGRYPVQDPQAIRNPRPDSNTLATSRAIIWPVYAVKTKLELGYVTVSVA